MEAFIHGFHEVIACVAQIAKLMLEGLGILILIITAFKSSVGFFKKHHHVGLQLAKGISTSLTFMMGGEVLATLAATSWDNILILGAMIILRVVINFVLIWEIGHEEQTLQRAKENIKNYEDIKESLAKNK